jgi:hypothetical protein
MDEDQPIENGADAHGPDEVRPRPLPGRKPTPVISLVAVRAEQAAKVDRPAHRKYAWPAVVMASLLAGLAIGHQFTPTTIGDSDDALFLSPTIVQALDTRLSGQPGLIGIALSFRDHDDLYCRSFVAQHIGGVACRSHGIWLLRYAAPVDPQHIDHGAAGGEPASARVVAAMIGGDPLDPPQERQAIAKGWQ